VLREKYAFLMESSSLEYEAQQNCNLTQIGGVLGSKGYGIALQKSRILRDKFKKRVMHFLIPIHAIQILNGPIEFRGKFCCIKNEA